MADPTIIPPARSVNAVILAGGKSSRFGSNKALASWNKKGNILDNIIEKARTACGSAALSVRNIQDYPQYKLPKFPDIEKEKGPMGGLYSALFHSTTEWIFLLGCDMPLIEPKLLKYMIEIRTWAPVIIPFCRNRFEPLHAVYHRSLLPIAENLIRRDKLRMRELLDLVPMYVVDEKKIIDIAGSLRCLSNINTLSQFRKILSSVPS